jgi:hypothetical protein
LQTAKIIREELQYKKREGECNLSKRYIARATVSSGCLSTDVASLNAEEITCKALGSESRTHSAPPCGMNKNPNMSGRRIDCSGIVLRGESCLGRVRKEQEYQPCLEAPPISGQLPTRKTRRSQKCEQKRRRIITRTRVEWV